MNQPPNPLAVTLANIGCVVLPILTIALLSSAGLLGWVLNSIAIVVLLLLAIPAIAAVALRWWLRRNLITDQCPSCGYRFTGLNNTECRCPNCGEPLKVTGGCFQRLTPPGTIDVDAVEVSAKQLED